jgi:hypothetical protein
MAYVTLTTDTKNFHYERFTGSASAPNRILTGTKPASATGSVVFGSSLNYIKLKIYSSANTAAQAIHIFGWNYVQELNAYVPQLLASVTGSVSTASQTVNGFTVFEFANWTLVQGDSKLFNGVTTTTPGGWLLIDTLGCEYIEVYGNAANTFHVIHAGL